MDDMEEKLGAILGNPQMMQQIMAMAQAMGQSQDPPKAEQAPPAHPPKQPSGPTMPSMQDAAMLQRIASIAQHAGVDKNQQALLKALSPYLSRERISKLEKAMRAATIAGLASTALGSSGFPFISGR